MLLRVILHFQYNLHPPQNHTAWTMQVRVPYVKFPINCRGARWPRGSLASKFGTSPKSDHVDPHPWVERVHQPWLAASLGEGQFRIDTHECQVCWTDSACEDTGSMDMSQHPETMAQLPLCFRGRFLSQRLGEGHSNRKPTASWSSQLS